MRAVHSLGPVVVIVCPERIDDVFVRALAHDFEPILCGDARYACITDTTRLLELPGPKQRKVLADWMNRTDVGDRQKVLNVGSSTLIQSAPMRAILTALYWLWTPPTPQHASRDVDDALDWCVSMLARDKVPLGTDEAHLRARVRMICGSRSTQPPPPPP